MTNSTLIDDEPAHLALPAEDDEAASEDLQRMATVMMLLRLAAWAFVAVLAANLYRNTLVILTARDYGAGLLTLTAVDQRVGGIVDTKGLVFDIYITSLLVVGLIYVWFNVRAVSNLKVFSRRHISMGLVGVAIGPILPIFNLVKPYQVMMTLWSRTREHVGQSAAHPVIAAWWWFSWLGGLLFSWLANLVDSGGQDATTLTQAEQAAIVFRNYAPAVLSDLLFMLSTFCMLAIASVIARTQDQIRSSLLSLSPPPAP